MTPPVPVDLSPAALAEAGRQVDEFLARKGKTIGPFERRRLVIAWAMRDVLPAVLKLARSGRRRKPGVTDDDPDVAM